MSKLTKSIAAIALAVLMLVAAFPVSAADAALYYVGEADLADNHDANQIDGLAVEDGILTGKSIGGDPYVYINTAVAADDVDVVEVAVKNESESDAFQLFFISDTTGGPSEPNSFRASYSDYEADEDGFVTFAFNTADNAGWAGTITGLRIDAINAEGAFTVKSVKFLSNDANVAKISFFDGAKFTATNAVKNVFTQNGFLVINVKESTDRVDPYLHCRDLAINAAQVGKVEFKVKTSAKADLIKIYFTNENGGDSEDRVLSAKLSECPCDKDGWYTVSIDVNGENAKGWAGTITAIRLDPVEANGVSIFTSFNFVRNTVAEAEAIAAAKAAAAAEAAAAEEAAEAEEEAPAAAEEEAAEEEAPAVEEETVKAGAAISYYALRALLAKVCK